MSKADVLNWDNPADWADYTRHGKLFMVMGEDGGFVIANTRNAEVAARFANETAANDWGFREVEASDLEFKPFISWGEDPLAVANNEEYRGFFDFKTKRPNSVPGFVYYG